jgi:hypothetical protein
VPFWSAVAPEQVTAVPGAGLVAFTAGGAQAAMAAVLAGKIAASAQAANQTTRQCRRKPEWKCRESKKAVTKAARQSNRMSGFRSATFHSQTNGII